MSTMEKSPLKFSFILMAGISVLSGVVLTMLFLSANALTVESLRNDSFFVYDTPRAVESFSLTDDAGEAFTNANLQGHWTAVFFGYTFCPDICPLTMASMKQFYDLLSAQGEDTDFQVVMISVDPERDTQEVLSNYVKYFNPAFIGVTGEYAPIYTLARQMNITFNYVAMNDDNYLVNHNGEVMLIDPQGNNAGFFKPPYQPEPMLENFLAVKKFLSR
jgi:protein SCO1/2